MVIKPSRGSASKNVYKCEDSKQSRMMFERILGIPGYANGTISDAVLIQAHIDGEEYCVDTVSCDGEHKIVAIWKCEKRQVSPEASFVFSASEIVSEPLVEFGPHVYASMKLYVRKVLDSFEVRYGPSHLELKVQHHDKKGSKTGDQIVLIEANIGRVCYQIDQLLNIIRHP